MGLFLIKLGGSSISDKTKPLSYREDWVRGFSRVVLKFLREGHQFIFIHGGGSFAHPLALSYGLSRYVDEQQTVGISLTSAVLFNLSFKLTMTMTKEGLPIYPIRTGSIYAVNNGKPQLLIDTAHLRLIMSRGLIPMLFGDVVPSDEGFSIISGDDIMLDLGMRLRPNTAVFLTDVRGVLDPNGNLIKVVKSLDVTIREMGHIDVTGGLIKKLRVALELSRYARTYLCGIWDLDSIRDVLSGGEPLGCTEFRTE
ncbi:isopentenyl phosphate kinase [Vulcanisaeta thermophila]|uniref:isopentenyl phosphate kinase n=1 Tax=Vulcanisaeta thermophila TaxID=867917 RepID=UPI0008529DC5|nr:isopentenyl phosphate kinase [Vulcanisaeta thermophila]